MLFRVAGILVLSGASGAAAVFVGRDAILGLPERKISGVACTTVATVRLQQNGQTWLRRYVRADAVDGDVRVKTALRVAGAFSNKETADLYQVILLDEAGPVNRADMRGRAIGAEVLFSREPERIPGMAAAFVARYIDGKPAGNGVFYGERKELGLDDIKAIVTGMNEREGCSDTEDSQSAETNHGEAAHAEYAEAFSSE
ncbi:MAG: hypothetical protein QHC90_18295 [Shinella sp.]|nr:hypothetical protein [Shinella sp.]